MLENLQAALSMSSQKTLTQFMALIGDPIGRLETVQAKPYRRSTQRRL
jgi:hypothetical protein